VLEQTREEVDAQREELIGGAVDEGDEEERAEWAECMSRLEEVEDYWEEGDVEGDVEQGLGDGMGDLACALAPQKNSAASPPSSVATGAGGQAVAVWGGARTRGRAELGDDVFFLTRDR
jgi:hypothetical protein